MKRPVLFFVIAATFLAQRNEGVAQTYNPRGAGVAYQTRSFLYNRPTVSPYLNLTRASSAYSANYQTLVRPQVEARERAMAENRHMAQLQQQVAEVRRNYQRQQSGNGQRATGHPTRFMTYLNYYPGLNR